MRYLCGIAISLVLLTQAGCGQKKEPSEAIAATPTTSYAPPVADATALGEAPSSPAEAPAAAIVPPPPSSPAARPTATSRLLIYHADVRLKTTAMPRATARLDSLVQGSGGYLSAATETHADGEWRQETTIRVPPARFAALLGGLVGLGTVEEKKLSTDDVTAEHADVAARLQAKRAVERQYTALLTKARKIKDILDIEEKLGGVREEIEATESRLKTLNDEVAYATITLTLYQPLAQTVPDAPVVSLGSRTVEAFYGGWQLFISLLLGVLNLWPLVLGAGIAGWWWRRRVVARRPGPLAATAPA